MIGTVLNNLGSAYKASKNKQQAEFYLRQSIQYNRAVLGDSAETLAYSFFHLGGLFQARAELDSVRYYAQKSEAIAKKHGLKELLEKIYTLLTSLGEGNKK